MAQHHPSDVAIEIYVRELLPGKNDQLDDILDRVNRLETSGIVDSSEVYVTGKAVCPKTATVAEHGRFLCERVKEFRDWAQDTDKRLDSFFPLSDVRSKITGETYRAISFPTVAIAEYADGTLQFVSPCTDGETTYTPSDRLDELSAVAAQRDSGRGPMKS